MKIMSLGASPVPVLIVLLSIVGALFAQTSKRAQTRPAEVDSESDYLWLLPVVPSAVLRSLDLTPEQETQLKAVIERNHDRGYAANRRLSKARCELYLAIMTNQPDASVIEQRKQEVADAWANTIELFTAVRSEVRAHLTPEQVALYNKINDNSHRREASFASQPIHILGRRLLRALNLSAEQNSQLEAMFERYEAEDSAVNLRIQDRSRALERTIMSADFNDAAVHARASELTANRADLSTFQANVLVQLRDILTPRQVERYHELTRNRCKRFSQ
jgi:Spy/CpxP family protein refolding chaperone